MCGLTGFARRPDAPHMDLAKIMLCDLLQSIESRGRHATGIGTCGGSDSFIWKWAESASVVLKSKVWEQTLDRISGNTVAVIGHTRHATHSNAKQDEAAHPFREGRVIGAHNGIIYNWRDIERKLQRKKDAPAWMVDSQAALGLLDRYKRPERALQELEGYFALTWWKNGLLYMARSSEAPLSVAYVPAMRTVFWNSEERHLRNVMDAAGIKPNEYDLWSTKSETIYELDPDHFDDHGCNPEKMEVKLERSGKVKIHASHKNNLADNSRSTSSTWKQGDYGQSRWDSTLGREVFKDQERALEPTRQASKQVSLLDMQRQIVAIQAKLETLEAENEYIYKVLEDNGLLEVFDEEVEEPVTQAKLALYPSCYECGVGESPLKGELLKVPGQGHVHEKCIFPTEKETPKKAVAVTAN